MAALVIQDASYLGANLFIQVICVTRHQKIVVANMLFRFGN